MKRLHLIEIADQPWCPRTIRNGLTDFLQTSLATTKPYAPVAPLLAAALQRAGVCRILDLCSGGAGPWLWLQPILARSGVNVTVCLSDKYPNRDAFQRSREASGNSLSYCSEPVDATCVAEELTGFRTLFTAFHHFDREQASAVLNDAVVKRQGIGIFEATQRTPAAVFITMLSPLVVLALTPFIRPFRWWRLCLTYLIPIVPLVTLFDGVVSCFRTYSVQELGELAGNLNADGFVWEVGEAKSANSPLPITYLIGVPRMNDAERATNNAPS